MNLTPCEAIVCAKPREDEEKIVHLIRWRRDQVPSSRAIARVSSLSSNMPPKIVDLTFHQRNQLLVAVD
jgi:hypothetical protein